MVHTKTPEMKVSENGQSQLGDSVRSVWSSMQDNFIEEWSEAITPSHRNMSGHRVGMGFWSSEFELFILFNVTSHSCCVKMGFRCMPFVWHYHFEIAKLLCTIYVHLICLCSNVFLSLPIVPVGSHQWRVRLSLLPMFLITQWSVCACVSQCPTLYTYALNRLAFD